MEADKDGKWLQLALSGCCWEPRPPGPHLDKEDSVFSIIATGFQDEGKVGWRLPRVGRGLTFLPSFLGPQEGGPT